MYNNERVLHLDVCDYNKRKICPLYSAHSQISGQATDVFRTTERNGWKELSFSLPSTCMTEHGSEDNFRLEHLKAGFMIRAIDNKGTDWYIISEPKIQHSAYSKTVQVTAGHVSQLLKMKNLGLEFSDDEGNNVGTAQELLTTILAGTGWKVGYIYPFAEKNGDAKVRSLKASAKTGAFKLITMMCDLFDAKPDFHGDTRTVDILPINPFSEPDPGKIPDLSQFGLDSQVVELHYGHNVSNVTRTQNTDNIVTKLYAYGAYGDKTSGYCGIDECTHIEYEYTLTEPCEAGLTYYFVFRDTTSEELTYHFTPNVSLPTGSKIIYSLLDPSSMLYIWDDDNQKAYPVIKGTNGTPLIADCNELTDVKNWFQFIMNFDYYRTVGLMTDEMIQALGEYQRNATKLYQDASDAALVMSEAQTILSKTIGYIDFCLLDVSNEISDNGYAALVLNKTDEHPDGVIYRSDYDKTKDSRFKWRVTESLNADGDPINSAAGLVYIVHNTNPISWDKAYLKTIDDNDDPSAVTLWSEHRSLNIDVDTDKFFLFSYNGINGRLGTLESNDEAAVMSLADALRVVTVDHPVYFTEELPLAEHINDINGYGWLWKYSLRGLQSEMYFAYTDEGDTSWNYVYFTDVNPGGAEENSYWFNWRDSVLFRRKNSEWIKLDTSAEKKIAALFATVYMFCKARDRYYQGIAEYYTYTVPDDYTLPAGNYFFENEYNSYWTFTTTTPLSSGDILEYNYDNGWVTQTHNGIDTTIKPLGYRFDNVSYHPSNLLSGRELENGSIDSDGLLKDDVDHCRSQSFISVVPLTKYSIYNCETNLHIHYYDDKQGWLGSKEDSHTFTTPSGCSYIRICVNTPLESFTSYTDIVIRADESEHTIVIEDLNYQKLDATPNGENIGLISCVSKFAEYANKTYGECYASLKAAQDAIAISEQNFMEVLGDIYREGWWSDPNYVDGDEIKLYEDALENLNQVAKPEATYNITFLDLMSANDCNYDYGATTETVGVAWPDINHMDAIHLIDPEIAVNTWAFVDKIQKCYDKPWRTKISINTNLSTIAQHSFTDVMTNIANVASEMKGKKSYYDKTINTAVQVEDVAQISAQVTKAEKDLMSTSTRVSEIDGTVYSINQSLDGFSTRVETIEGSSIIKQTAQAIQAVVRDNPNDKNEFKTSSVSISKDGVAISTSGTFSVASENDDEKSAVLIGSKGINIGSTGVFTVQTDNFEVTADGQLMATNAVINGQISNNGYPVLSRNYDIHIGSAAPQASILHAGMIWIKPTTSSDDDYDDEEGGDGGNSGGGGSEGGDAGDDDFEITTPVNFIGYTDSDTRHSFYDTGAASVVLYADSYSQAANNSYLYDVTIPLYLSGRSGNGKHGGRFVVTLNGVISVSEDIVWSTSESNSSMYDTITLSVVSPIWLGDLPSITLTISVKHLSGSYTGNIYLDRGEEVRVECSAEEDY